MRRLVLLTLLASAVLTACTEDLSGPGEPLRLLAVSLPAAFDGEPYEAVLRPTGGVRPFQFEVVDGALPPGLRLEAGRLVGTPSAQGRYGFTVEVRDANLNRTVQRLEVSVGPLPEPRLSVDVPLTELQRASELRLRLERGRGWRGAEIEIRWDAERFGLVEGSVRTAERNLIAVWESAPGLLRVDVAALGAGRSSAVDLLVFTLEPIEPARLSLELVAVSTSTAGVTRSDARFGAAAQQSDAAAQQEAPIAIEEQSDEDADREAIPDAPEEDAP